MEFLKPPKGSRSAKRIVGRGRGSGRGKTSGKVHKGQNSRSGGGVRPGFEGGQMPIYRRVARRGFSNYPFKKSVVPVNLSTLQRVFKSGDTVTLESLKEHRVVKSKVELVKILASGEIKKKLTVKDLPMSAAARAKIEAAGGTVSGAAAEAPAETQSETAAESETQQPASTESNAESSETDGSEGDEKE
jgi:large subunit ribosomal protein L15